MARDMRDAKLVTLYQKNDDSYGEMSLLSLVAKVLARVALARPQVLPLRVYVYPESLRIKSRQVHHRHGVLDRFDSYRRNVKSRRTFDLVSHLEEDLLPAETACYCRVLE